MRTVWTMIAGCVLGCAVLSAADVWDTKPYAQWTDKEVEKILTDSPWAGKASLTHARQGAVVMLRPVQRR